MYERFGAAEVGDTGVAELRVFFPDAALDPAQYTDGGAPRITRLRAIGTFQATPWDVDTGLELTAAPYEGKGQLWTARTGALPPGFYEYQYYVEFETSPPRRVSDPCAKYGGTRGDRSGFVVDRRADVKVALLDERPPLQDLVVYELMIDDFTAEFRGGRAPLAALTDKVQYLAELGVNAVELMPWTAWPGDGFDWGYNPYALFTVAHRYTYDPRDQTKKLSYLKDFISACHRKGIAVIMDGVFDHVATSDDGGFAYDALYDDRRDCPFTGNFEEHGYDTDLNYANGCTQAYVLDVCRYWIDTFGIDGFRLDDTVGYYDPTDPRLGLTPLLAGVSAATAGTDFSTTLEHDWSYGSVDVTNRVGATSCWFYPLFWSLWNMGGPGRGIGPELMRTLNASFQFGAGRRATTFVENHDHTTLVALTGGRDVWWRAQPWLIALFTAPGTPLLHNGQEWGQVESFPEPGQDSDANPRVVPRPLRWAEAKDGAGAALGAITRQLIAMYRSHPGLRSTSFYPQDWQSTTRDANGFGIDTDLGLCVYHRWGPGEDGVTEYFIVALNFSPDDRVDVFLTFPFDGAWVDLLTGDALTVAGNRATVTVTSNWGRVWWASAR